MRGNISPGMPIPQSLIDIHRFCQADGDFGVFGILTRHIDIAENASHEIVEIVGNAAGQNTEGFQSLDITQGLFGLLTPGDVYPESYDFKRVPVICY
jgi:hypothetical protein